MIQPFSLTSPATWTGVLIPILAAILTLAIGYFLARFAQRAVKRWLARVGGNAVTIRRSRARPPATSF